MVGEVCLAPVTPPPPQLHRFDLSWMGGFSWTVQIDWWGDLQRKCKKLLILSYRFMVHKRTLTIYITKMSH